MRLLNTKILKLEEFWDANHTLPYAILSHTWEKEEVSFQAIADLESALNSSDSRKSEPVVTKHSWMGTNGSGLTPTVSTRAALQSSRKLSTRCLVGIRNQRFAMRIWQMCHPMAILKSPNPRSPRAGGLLEVGHCRSSLHLIYWSFSPMTGKNSGPGGVFPRVSRRSQQLTLMCLH